MVYIRLGMIESVIRVGSQLICKKSWILIDSLEAIINQERKQQYTYIDMNLYIKKITNICIDLENFSCLMGKLLKSARILMI